MLIPPSQRPEVSAPVTGRKGFRGGNACLFYICLFCPVQNLCILFLPECLAKIANKIGRLGFLETIKMLQARKRWNILKQLAGKLRKNTVKF